MKETADKNNSFAHSQSGEHMQYLITGADGFVGREIAAQLLAGGYPVRGLVRRIRPHIPLPEGMEIVAGDVLAPDSLDALFAGIEPTSTVLIHTAAAISVRKRNPHCECVNLIGTENILAACKRHGLRRLVHFGSVDALPPAAEETVISEPERFCPDALPTAYGRSKAAAAQRVLDAAAAGLDCTILLPSAVVGPGDYKKGFITQMLALYLLGLSRLSIKGGYEFVDVRDVAAAAIVAAQQSGRGECYILSNRYASITEVLNTLAACTGRKPPRRTLPLQVLYPAAPLLTASYLIAGREPPLTFGAARLMRIHPAYCHDKATRDLGFTPRPLEQTLADTAAFMSAQRKR